MMKVALYFISKGNWIDSNLAGLYTKKELEELKKEIIKKYRECDDYLYDIKKNIDEYLICEAALGKEEQVKEFKEAVRIIEEETLTGFIDNYVTN